MNRDLSKFDPPKVEPDGLTKKLFGRPAKKSGVETHDAEMTEDDKRKLFYAEDLLKAVSSQDLTWLALGPYAWPMLKEALSDYISKMKEMKR